MRFEPPPGAAGDEGGSPAPPPDPDRPAGLARMAAGIAHELRNPLAVVLARVQLLQLLLGTGQPVPRAKLEQALEAIEEQALRASKVIENLSGFARPRPPVIARVDLPDLVAHVLALVRPRVQAAGIGVEVIIPPEVKAVWADHGQLITALGQLVLNAIEAMPGGGALRIRAARMGDAVELAVADEGPGIAPDDAPRIFDPFFSTKPSSSGLGLSVAQAIAEAHGGSLRLERSAATGAEFVLSLSVTGEA